MCTPVVCLCVGNSNFHSSLPTSTAVCSVLNHYYILAPYTLTWQTSFLGCPDGWVWPCLSCKVEEVLVSQLSHQHSGVFLTEQSASWELHRQFRSVCVHVTVGQVLFAGTWCWDGGTGSQCSRCNWTPSGIMKEWKQEFLNNCIHENHTD